LSSRQSLALARSSFWNCRPASTLCPSDLWDLCCITHPRRQRRQQQQQQQCPRLLEKYILTCSATLTLHSTTEVRRTRILQGTWCTCCSTNRGVLTTGTNRIYGATSSTRNSGRKRSGTGRGLVVATAAPHEVRWTRVGANSFFQTAVSCYRTRGIGIHGASLFSPKWRLAISRPETTLEVCVFNKHVVLESVHKLVSVSCEEQLDDWRPDGSYQLVVAAHLKERKCDISNVLDADSFVRRCVRRMLFARFWC
jgi:hypothetical protein